MSTPVELIDEFLTTYKYRGAFGSTEVFDILLDVRHSLTNDRIQKEPTPPDRPDNDSGEPSHGEAVEAIISS